jgi:hypothetical protein
MRFKTAIAAATVAAGLALVGTAVSAAPVSAPLANLKADAQATSPIENVSYRCWWRHGRRHCSYATVYVPPVLSFYAGPRYGGGHRYYGPRHHGPRHFGHYRRW